MGQAMSHLVSYPRTGSHWLRLALRLYLGREELPFEHTHDLDLSLDSARSVYLWREDAAAVVFSRITYERWEASAERIAELADEYAAHREHWLPRADLAVTYEEMTRNLGDVLERVSSAFGVEPEPGAGIVPDLDYVTVAGSTEDRRAVVWEWRDRYERRRERFRQRLERMAARR